jgi:gas vesicle protein
MAEGSLVQTPLGQHHQQFFAVAIDETLKRRNDMPKSDGAGMLLTFIVGAGVGALAALLFAPKSGDELRSDIVDTATDGVDQVLNAGKQVRQRATRLVDMAKAQVQDAVEAGEAAYNQAAKKA